MKFSIDDRVEISDLYMRYTHTIDRGDGAGWAQCFTETGRLELPYRGQKTVGRDALIAVGDAFPTRTDRNERHVVTNVRFVEEGDGARGAAYLMMLRGGSGDVPPEFSMTGTYDDHLVRVGGKWLFESRIITVDVY